MPPPEASTIFQPNASPVPGNPPVGEAGASSPARITVEELARRLDLGRAAVYVMLEQGIIPAIRLGRRWIVTRHAFENWERTCGMPTGLHLKTEQ